MRDDRRTGYGKFGDEAHIARDSYLYCMGRTGGRYHIEIRASIRREAILLEYEMENDKL